MPDPSNPSAPPIQHFPKTYPAVPRGRMMLVSALAFVAVATACPPASAGSKTPDISTRPEHVLRELNKPGAEGAMLEAQVGTWEVTETAWNSPTSKPTISSDLIAERQMAGNMLEETLRTSSDPAILRRDFLTFKRVEGRWDYMSFDARDPDGMMFAQSYGPAKDGRIELFFQPFAFAVGEPAIGQMLRMREEIVLNGPDHVVKDQYFKLADGVGEEWLGHRYDAVRIR